MAVTHNALSIELIGPVASVPSRSGAQAGIEPAMAADTVSLSSLPPDPYELSTPVHPRVRRPPGGLRSRYGIESRDGRG